MITGVKLSTRGGRCVLLKLLKDMLLPPDQSVLAQMLIKKCSHANWVVSCRIWINWHGILCIRGGIRSNY